MRYFCCRLTPSGIGDLLSQLNRLHDLGRRWGLEYLHRDLPRNRWSPDLDVSDFLGLALGEQRLETMPGCEIASVDAARAAEALDQGRPLESLLRRSGRRASIIEFVHSSQLYARGQTVQLQYPIDLRGKFEQRQKSRLAALRARDHLSVCMHVRQGDCTWVPRGSRRVFLGMRKIAADSADVDVRRAPSADQYAPVLDEVSTALRGRVWTLQVYSDGPSNIFPVPARWYGNLLYRPALAEPRILAWLRLARARHPMHALYNPMCDAFVRQGHDRALTALDRLTAGRCNARILVGRDAVSTEDAILSFATTDIAIVGRSTMAFPLLGLGDPDTQAILRLSDSPGSRRATLDRLLARRKDGEIN